MPYSSRSNCTEKVFDTFSLPQVPFYIEGKSRGGSNDLFRGFPNNASRVVNGLEIGRTTLDATSDLSDHAAISVWSRLSLREVFMSEMREAIPISQPVPHFERFLDSREAAALLQIHPKTLQRLARKGEIRAMRIGKLWRFRASDLHTWVDLRLSLANSIPP